MVYIIILYIVMAAERQYCDSSQPKLINKRLSGTIINIQSEIADPGRDIYGRMGIR